MLEAGEHNNVCKYPPMVATSKFRIIDLTGPVLAGGIDNSRMPTPINAIAASRGVGLWRGQAASSP